MTYGKNFLHINFRNTDNANLTTEDLNSSTDETDNWCTIHGSSYDTWTSRAQWLSNGQHSYGSWNFEIFDESHWYKSQNRVGWQIGMKARIIIKLPVAALPGFHSLCNWCYQAMWPFAGVPEDADNDSAMQKLGGVELYSAVKSLMHDIRTKDEEAQQDTAHWMTKIPKLWMISWWRQSALLNGKPLIHIPQDTAHLIDLRWTEEEQAKLKTLLERYTSRCPLGACSVHRWQLACLIAASMFFIWVGRQEGSLWHFWTMVQWMAACWLGGFPDFLMTERQSTANPCQHTRWVSRTWPRRRIKCDTPSWSDRSQCTGQCTSSTKGIEIWFSS